MSRYRRIKTLLVTVSLLLVCEQGQGEEIKVAVASNFAQTMRAIVVGFEETSGHEVTIVVGSTGKHYAQIRNGAPLDVFFAADLHRPSLLENEGIAIPGTRFTYAFGRLVLWSPRESFVDTEGRVLGTDQFRHLAIANPRLAPYGVAAKQVLEERGLWEAMQGRLVRGENIGQTFQFVASGNAGLGFVALSQIKRHDAGTRGSYWMVPQGLYRPIEQQAVLLRDTVAGRALLDYARSETARAIIRSYGYDTPD